MDVIELLLLAGVLEEVKIQTKDDKVQKLILNNDWNKIKIKLCMDGLSLDCHRNLQLYKRFEQAIFFNKICHVLLR